MSKTNVSNRKIAPAPVGSTASAFAGRDAEAKPKKERKPREPKSIEKDLAAIQERWAKPVNDLREAEQKLEARLADVRRQREVAEKSLAKILAVTTAEGGDGSGDGPAAADRADDAAVEETSTSTPALDEPPLVPITPAPEAEPTVNQ